MPQVNTEWRVFQHDPIEELSERVWRVEGSVPSLPLRRTMTVVRLASDDLVIHNGIAVDDATRSRIEAWGRPRWLLVPNGWHRLDAPAYRARYSDIHVLCPSGSRKKIEQVVRVDGTYEDFPASSEARLETLAGVRDREGALVVRDGHGATLVLNDIVFNQPHLPGAFGFFYKLLRQSGGPRITTFARLAMVADKAALAEHLRRLAGEPDLQRIVVSHIEPIVDRPGQVLRGLADALQAT